MSIDGKKIAEEILAELGDELRGLRIGIVMNQGNAASESFVRIKERTAQRLGVEITRYAPQGIAVAIATNDGVLVQLPIAHADELRAHIPPHKDIDNQPQAPVAAAVEEIFLRYNVKAKNKKAVVVGAGRLVGAPVAELLRDLDAEVKIITRNDGNLMSLKDADIVILGAGEPGLVKPEMLKKGVVLLDAGTSESAGKLVGDADPACAEVASVFTPVPGGIGPIAVAMLFKNLLTLARRHGGLAQQPGI